jgi:hypothetical protein
VPTASTFGQRFAFARVVQSFGGVTETDTAFGKAIGVVSGAMTGYKNAITAPPAERVLVIAKRCGVDPGWLAFGEDTTAEAPPGFQTWLARQPKHKNKIRVKRAKKKVTVRVAGHG